MNINDIEVQLTIVVGKTKVKLKDVENLERGSVVLMDELAGEEVTLYANDTAIAKGQVVVSGEKYGLKINKILNGNNDE
jgi:flagellar motor switch protein FliN/FliY